MSGAFSSSSDLSGKIKIEGEKISLEFLTAQPQVGQGTIMWNIPSPIEGCVDQASKNSAYCGILILASDQPLDTSTIPENGVKYTADPTLDPDIHVGDQINRARVIGAFYEGDKKSAGESMTTSMIVNDLDPDINYYIGCYAVSCTLEYHLDGIRAYSDLMGDKPTENNPSVSAIKFNDNDGIKGTDGTELDIGRQYSFEFDLNTNFPNDSVESNRVTVSFDGSEAQTYDQMIDTINSQLREIDNPPRSEEPPNFGSFLWNDANQELQKFNGTNYETVIDVIVGFDDPSDTPEGSYWFDQITKQLKQRNANVIPATDLWEDIPTIVDIDNPFHPDCGKIWFDGIAAHEWSGTTWCDVQTFIQDYNPSEMQVGICGQYWYSEATGVLNHYDPKAMVWIEKLAIYWEEAPDSLSSDTLWFSTTERVLRSRIQFGEVVDWNLEIKFVIGEVEPVKSEGLYWYRESTNDFFQYTGGEFVTVDVLEWHEDPTDVTSCELWWDERSNKLHEWDTVNLEWDEVVLFTESDIDPLAPAVIETKAIWLDTENNMIKSWDGSYFDPIDNYVDHPSDPTQIKPDDIVAWYNPDTDIVMIPSTTKGEWIVASPIIGSDFDPEFIPVGKVWFDSNNNSLKMWNGIAWVSIPYTTKPIINNKGDLWLNTNTDTLMTWNGKKWVQADPKIRAFIDSRGHIQFKTRETGSCVSLLMIVPGYTWDADTREGPGVTWGGGPMHYAGYRSVYTDNPFDIPKFLDSNLREDEFLFNELPDSQLQPVVLGTDTAETVPAYAQIGVGTDGTPDERRRLIHETRIQLGYPVVDVELTEEQIDHAITRSIGELRQRSDVAYRRGFYLLDIRPGSQVYTLTNKKIGFNKIVTIMGAFRRSGAFGGGYSSNSVFDQLFAQQLYGSSTAGGFDMTTLYLSQQYLELIEMMFATKLNFHFDESNRQLHFHQDFHKHERVLLDTAIDRTEQELFKDRWVKNWIERHTIGLARLNLAQIRGKFGALPGAGGGVSLDAADLYSQSAADLQYCDQQLEDFVASSVEQFGAFDFVMG